MDQVIKKLVIEDFVCIPKLDAFEKIHSLLVSIKFSVGIPDSRDARANNITADSFYNF